MKKLGVDWIQLAQDMDHLRIPVKTLINIQVSYKAANFLAN